MHLIPLFFVFFKSFLFTNWVNAFLSDCVSVWYLIMTLTPGPIPPPQQTYTHTHSLSDVDFCGGCAWWFVLYQLMERCTVSLTVDLSVWFTCLYVCYLPVCLPPAASRLLLTLDNWYQMFYTFLESSVELTIFVSHFKVIKENVWEIEACDLSGLVWWQMFPSCDHA